MTFGIRFIWLCCHLNSRWEWRKRDCVSMHRHPRMKASLLISRWLQIRLRFHENWILHRSQTEYHWTRLIGGSNSSFVPFMFTEQFCSFLSPYVVRSPYAWEVRFWFRFRFSCVGGFLADVGVDGDGGKVGRLEFEGLGYLRFRITIVIGRDRKLMEAYFALDFKLGRHLVE